MDVLCKGVNVSETYSYVDVAVFEVYVWYIVDTSCEAVA